MNKTQAIENIKRHMETAQKGIVEETQFLRETINIDQINRLNISISYKRGLITALQYGIDLLK